MRWDDLFDDLSARFDLLTEQDEAAELADRIRGEQGAITMVQRLAGARGGRIRLRLSAGSDVAGELDRIGPDWVLLRESASSETLVRLPAVTAMEGLTQATGEQLGAVDARYDFRLALRAVARDRAPVSVQTAGDGELTGTLDRVGADFVELASHAAWEQRRRPAVRSVVLVPLGSIEVVRSQPLG